MNSFVGCKRKWNEFDAEKDDDEEAESDYENEQTSAEEDLDIVPRAYAVGDREEDPVECTVMNTDFDCCEENDASPSPLSPTFPGGTPSAQKAF